MNVTAETSGQSPLRATSSSAPSPFWIVITVAPAMRPASRSAAVSTSVAFVARDEVALAADAQAVPHERGGVLRPARQDRDVGDLRQVPGVEAADDAGA